MGGNVGGNAGMSEFISLVLEPVSDEMKNSMEINATGGLIKDIEDVNEALDKEMNERNQNPSRIQQTDCDNGKAADNRTEDNSEESSLQEDDHEEPSLQEHDQEESSPQEEKLCNEQASARHHIPTMSTIKNNDIRLYMTNNEDGAKTIHVEEKHHGAQEDGKIDKMKMIREKMTYSRKRK